MSTAAHPNSIPKQLNLGCGFHPKPGFLNVDYSPVYKPDVVHDLNRMPWPLPDSHFERVEMDHVLEHLEDVRGVMSELERVLAPGGVLVIRVPHFSRGFTHWDHRRGFDFTFAIYFQESSSGGFIDTRLEHRGTRLTWFAQPHVKKAHLGPLSYAGGWMLGQFFDAIGNFNLFFTSRLLCYWVGGYDEISFTFTKKG